MQILFISAEVAPFAKAGGLADVAGALPPALTELGTDVRVIMPFYGCVKRIFRNGKPEAIKCEGKKYKIKLAARNIKIEFNGKKENINIYEIKLQKLLSRLERLPAQIGSGVEGSRFPKLRDFPRQARDKLSTRLQLGRNDKKVKIYLIENKKFFGGKEIYEPAGKFLFFSKAVVDIIKYSFTALCESGDNGFWPDIIHCNDNHTALIATLIKIKKLPIKTIFTIHNLEYQGQFCPDDLKKINVKPSDYKTISKDMLDGDINKMVQGILASDAVTTVSPTYAKEILTKEYGENLENILKKRKKHLYGIINGIDVDIFNPETDPHIKYHYSFNNLSGKRKNKEELLREFFGEKFSRILPTITRERIAPLIALISRLTPQKGIDLVIEALQKMFKKHPDLFFILLGTGLTEYEEKLKKLGELYPDNFKPLIKFDLRVAQQIYAGADMFLMPSKFEPCGLGQLIAMRYGAAPIVRKTGGLADTIINLKTQNLVPSEAEGSNLKTANGFIFEEYSAEEMLKAIDEAIKTYHNEKVWKQLVLNGMKKDCSWRASAKKYLEIYRQILK